MEYEMGGSYVSGNSSVGRAPDCRGLTQLSGGRWFDSALPDYFYQLLNSFLNKNFNQNEFKQNIIYPTQR